MGIALRGRMAAHARDEDVRNVYNPAMLTLVVDPWHWLTVDGGFPVDKPALYRRVLRVARLIEYGGPLAHHETRGTLVECRRRPAGHACVGLLWVLKTVDDHIVAHCLICKHVEVSIHNWQHTEWADGIMEPVPVELGDEARTTH